MLRMIPGPTQRGIASGLFTLALGLALIAAACGEPTSGPDTPTPSSAGQQESVPDESMPPYIDEPEEVSDMPAASVTPGVEDFASDKSESGDDDSAVLIMSDLIEFHGAGTASLDDRIYESHGIVRACLLSAADGVLWFRAIEYLRGSGTDEFIVWASTDRRNKEWDGREAVLFLRYWWGDTTTQTSGSRVSEFVFTDTESPYVPYTGKLPEGYTIDTRNPVWLPAASESGTTTSGTDGASGPDPEFITDLHSPTGAPYPIVSLAELRAKIAWVKGGEGIEGYDSCLRYSLGYLAYYRDWETYHGSEWEPYQSERQVASGAEEGTVISDYGLFRGERGYGTFTLTDPDSSGSRDARFFSSLVVDNDEVASNGYSRVLATARPLPSGTYRFLSHVRRYEYIPCEFFPVNNRLKWTITVTSPPGTVHEAFFDPVALTPGVGFSATSGVLDLAAFSIGGTSTSIKGLKWATNAVVMTLSPYVSLSGQTVDFIELDGSVGLSLAASSATANSTAGTLTWTVTEQPWEDGDQLMLRIGAPPPAISLSDLASSVDEGATDSFTVSVSNLPSTVQYSIGVATYNASVGFNNDCTTLYEDVTIPLGNTSHTASFTLHGCTTPGGTVTAMLLHEGAAVIWDISEVAVTVAP